MSVRPRVLVLSGLLAAASLLCAWTLSRPAPLRLVAYGTSLTAKDLWPQALGAVWSACLGREVENAAKDGMDVRWGDANLEERVIRLRPDVVLVEFAINDAAKDHKISKEESAEGVEFADVAAAWRWSSEAAGGLSKDLPDDLHPTLKAHLRTILPAVLSVLSPSCAPSPSFLSP